MAAIFKKKQKLFVKEISFTQCISTKNFDPARIRTWNLLIRSQTPYPFGHEAATMAAFFPFFKT